MATWRKTLSSNQYYEVILNVNQTSQSIPNNTSNISWSLQVRKSFGSGFWGADSTASTWSVTIDGVNVSSSSSSYDFRGGAPLTKTIASGTRTITHGGDGSKSIAVSGYWKDNVNGLGSATVSATMALSTIPRASELSAFSFVSHLKNGVENTINYTVSRKSDSFRHQILLMDGSTTVLSWDNISSNGASTITLTAANVNTLLTRMPTNTTKTFTLRVATRSGVGGGWIGSAVTRTATGTVHADVKPVLSGLSFGIDGSRIDKTINKYVQGYTRVTANFNRTAGYGSSIKSSTMTVQTTSGGNSQVINGNSGTTANPLSHSGSYRVVYTATDQRGRSTSATSANFTVQAYSPPSITSFTLTRGAKKATEVTVVANGTFSSVGGSNTATLNIQRRTGTTWVDVGTNNTSTSGSITRTVVSTDNLITSSYEFKAKITDLFGGVAESIDIVSTQRVVLDIHKNEGVGIGKIRERGVLDVDGEAYIRGVLTAQVDATGSALRLQSDLLNGHGYVGYMASDGTRKGWVGFGATNGNGFVIANEHTVDGDIRFQTTGKVKVNYDDVVGHGSNENGIWIRYYDGTQICWKENFTVNGFVSDSVLRSRWTYPIAFKADTGQQNGRCALFVTKNEYTSTGILRGGSEGSLSGSNNTYGDVFIMAENGGIRNGWGQGVRVLAIGRWK